jgi:hypothetical protein
MSFMERNDGCSQRLPDRKFGRPDCHTVRHSRVQSDQSPRATHRGLKAASAPLNQPAQRVVYQTPGINRFVRAEYAAYSSPNCSAIIFSSAPRRSARRTANAIAFEKPATQFGITRA